MPSQLPVGLLFLYGAVLFILTFLLAGLGHGSYLLLGLAGSPFSLIGTRTAFLACPVQWGLIALVQRRWHVRFSTLASYLVLHYSIGVMLIVMHASPYAGDVPALHRAWLASILFAVGLVWYLVGQAGIWAVGLGFRSGRRN